MKTVIKILILVTLISCADKNKLVSSVKFEGKYGFIDINGNWHIEPVFDSIGNFYNGYADSYKNDKNGIINSKGKTIIENKYDFIGNIEDGVFLILLDNQYNYINLNGQLISKKYFSDAADFSNGLAPVKFSKNGKWGYIDKKGKLKTDTIFDYAYDFNKKNAEVIIRNDSYLINKKGKIIDTLNDNYQKITKKLTLFGNSDRGTLGRINQKGDTVMRGIYTSFGYIQNGKFWYNKQGKYGLADTTGTILVQPIYNYLTYFSDNGLALTKKHEKFGYINEEGIVSIDFEFENAKGFKHGLAGVKVNGKWGFINKMGNIIIQPKFDRIEHQFAPISAKFELMYNFTRE